MQPGQTIKPGDQPTDAGQAEQKPAEMPVEQPQQTAPQPVMAESVPATVEEAPAAQPEPAQPFAESAPVYATEGVSVRWTASEYIDHAKGPAWFMGLGLALFVVVALIYFLLEDILAAVLIGLAGITFGVFAGRRPQVLEYGIDSSGIHIGQRSHTFAEFKSFSLTESGPLPAILLMPLKRFLPPITIFYDPNEEDKIVDALANYLPHEDREPDMVDRLMSRIRF